MFSYSLNRQVNDGYQNFILGGDKSKKYPVIRRHDLKIYCRNFGEYQVFEIAVKVTSIMNMTLQEISKKNFDIKSFVFQCTFHFM